MSSSGSDPNIVQRPPTLVLGLLGVGTFIVFFLAILNVLVWIFSSAMYPAPKVLSRLIAFLLFAIITIILLFAERESQYVDSGTILV